MNLFADAGLNHHTAVQGGVLAEPCGALLREFFAERRGQRRRQREAGEAPGIPTGDAIELEDPAA